MYYHGVRTEEKATSMPASTVVSSGLQVVIGAYSGKSGKGNQCAGTC